MFRRLGFRLLSHQQSRAIASRPFCKKVDDFITDKPKPTGEQNLLDPTDNEEKEYQQSKKNSAYMYLFGVIPLLGVYFLMEINKIRATKKKPKDLSVQHFGKSNIGGNWKLLDMKGNEFGSSNLEGKYYIIYFGFANCPDICPQTLSKFTQALKMLKSSSERKYIKLETIFVSVDPDRDTPEKIQHFLRHYDEGIIPVTARSNTDPSLKKMLSKFKIYSTKIELDDINTPPGQMKPYTIDHSMFSYLMSDENEFLAHLGANLSAADIAQTVINKILENERSKLLH